MITVCVHDELSEVGSGILPVDYPGIALKYYTSKIRSFDDIQSIHSFGFRCFLRAFRNA